MFNYKKFFSGALLMLVICQSSNLSNETKGWYFERRGQNEPPAAQSEIDIAQYNAHYLGDTTQKELYLTFDCGYENGYTISILDTLLEKGVTAAFFVTKPYILTNPDIVKRMVKEGHIVANHSDKHKSCPSLSYDELKQDLEQVEQAYFELIGEVMPKFFRPPMGQYSEASLKATFDFGYSSIFWSFAYEDWLVEKQPGAEKAFNTVIKHLHNGAILLLHSISESNAQALPRIIDYAQSQGYEFKSLSDLGKRIF